MRSVNLRFDDFDAKPLFSELIGYAAEKPYTFEEMRKALALIDKIEASDAEMLLEESEHEFLRERIGLARFVRVDRNVGAAINAVLEAPKVTVAVAGVKRGGR